MDYIQDILQRQKRVLETLMASGFRQTEISAEELEEDRLHRAQSEADAPHGSSQKSERKQSAGESHRLLSRARGSGEAAKTGNGGMTWERTGGTAREAVRQRIDQSRSTQVDAQAVSQLIQRDARRYDGGFSLY